MGDNMGILLSNALKTNSNITELYLSSNDYTNKCI